MTVRANWADDIDQYQLTQPEETPESIPEPSTAFPHRGLRFDDRPFGLQARLGAATTVGELGIVAEYDVLDRINVGIGIGTNVSGPMPGAHLRLRPLVVRNASGAAVHTVFVESGVSRGLYSGGLAASTGRLMCETCDEDPQFVPHTVWWWQVEIGWEMRWKSGISLRASQGVAMAIWQPDWRCTKDNQSVPCTGVVPPSGFIPAVLTFAVGYTF